MDRATGCTVGGRKFESEREATGGGGGGWREEEGRQAGDRHTGRVRERKTDKESEIEVG